METNFTWLNFFKIIVILVAVYFFLLLVLRLLPLVFKRKSVVNNAQQILDKIVEFYKPIAVFIILISFVAINYKVHGILLLVILVFSFWHIRRYFYGILFRTNPLIRLASNISSGEYKGDISKFLPFGIVINEDDGNRFINYEYIDKHGFSINHNDHASIRRTIYIYEQEKSAPVLDLLFNNPNINFNSKPIIKKVLNEDAFQLQIALENGAKIEALIDYLNQHNIKTSTK